MPTIKRKAKKEKRKCLYCGKTYTVMRPWQRYCRPKCSHMAYQLRMRERLRAVEEFMQGMAVTRP